MNKRVKGCEEADLPKRQSRLAYWRAIFQPPTASSDPGSMIRAFTLALLFAGTPLLAGEGIRWERDFQTAMRRAAASGKPIVIDFWAEWCGWCKRLDETTYIDSVVVKLSKRFVAVKVDTEGSPDEVAIAIQYGVTSLPTIAFLSPSGRQLLRVTGYQGPGKFPRTLEKALLVAERIGKWEKRLSRHPNDAESLHNIGLHVFEQSFYDESRELLYRAAQLDKKRPVKERKLNRLLLGVVQTYDRRYAMAEELFSEALRLEPRGEPDAKILYFLGRAYLKWGRELDAKKVMLQILKEHEHNPVADKARSTLASLRRRGY